MERFGVPSARYWDVAVEFDAIFWLVLVHPDAG